MGEGKPHDLGTGETVSTGGLARGPQNMQELAPGMMVGEYRVEGLLGEGGMGRVYSATHPVIAKRAAIKILHPELSVNREAVERFVQEARSVNQIGHPNIVDIFSFGNLPDGRCYFVMEWLRGQSLRDRLRKTPLPISDSLSIIETVAIALEAAHEKGIVHRDLKPDNIFLVDVKGTAPTVKLLDFGIAKLLGNDSDRVEKTRTGNLLGTPAYISPEQARGQHVDHRTDIYALGAVMYELLTGWLVFPAESAADMIAKHLYEHPPDARIKNPSVPPELANLVISMLAKDANRRPNLEQVRSILHPLRMGQYATPVGGGYPPMYTPQAPLQTPSSHPQLTPPPPQFQTGLPPTGVAPVAAMQSHVGTGTNVGLATGMPAKKSRLPIFLVVVLLLGGIGAAAAVAVTSGRDSKSAPAGDPPTDKVVKPADPAVDTTKPTVDTTKPAVDTAKPAVDTTKPAVDTTKPVVDTTKPVDATTKPAVDTTNTTANPTQPVDPKKAGVKKAGSKKTGSKTGTKRIEPDDPDAAM
jgi:serine/threonine-protein kinase